MYFINIYFKKALLNSILDRQSMPDEYPRMSHLILVKRPVQALRMAVLFNKIPILTIAHLSYRLRMRLELLQVGNIFT